MAAIDFNKMMAEELAKAKAHALKSNKLESKGRQNYETMRNDADNARRAFMDKRLEIDDRFTRLDPRVHRLPNSSTAYYIPDFLSSNASERVLSIIDSAPPSCWTTLKRRRLLCCGGSNFDKLEPLPVWCQQICRKMVTDSSIFDEDYNEPNHVLINEYSKGQGIMPHKDGPAYYERVCIVSLISTLCINFYRSIPLKNNNAECPADLQIVLEPRSCLIFQDDLYRIFHTIHECSYDIIDPNVANLTLLRNDSVKIGDKLMRSGKRISLTIRHVYTCDIIKSIDSALYFLRTSNL